MLLRRYPFTSFLVKSSIFFTAGCYKMPPGDFPCMLKANDRDFEQRQSSRVVL